MCQARLAHNWRSYRSAARAMYRPLRRCLAGAGTGGGEESIVGWSATGCVPQGRACPGVCKAPGASVGGTGDTPAIGEVAGGPCDEARDGVIPGVRLDGNGLRNVCIFIASTVVAAIVTCSGTGMLMALARATTMAEALGKR